MSVLDQCCPICLDPGGSQRKGQSEPDRLSLRFLDHPELLVCRACFCWAQRNRKLARNSTLIVIREKRSEMAKAYFANRLVKRQGFWYATGGKPRPMRVTAQAKKTRHERRTGHSGPAAKTYEYQGKSLTLAEWSEELGVKVDTLRSRAAKHWTTEEILGKPISKAGSQREGSSPFDCRSRYRRPSPAA